MNYVVSLAVAFVVLIWYIRPIYNFMAIRKYVLLNHEKLSLSKRIQSGLPAIVFYTLIFGLMFYPAYTNQLVSMFETGSVLTLQIIFIFLFTRYDKWQTKYKVTEEYLQFRKKSIKWDESYNVTFKRSALLILRKPRFIVKSKSTTIVVPMLSKNITSFIHALERSNQVQGKLAKELFTNTKNYYIGNIELAKEMNKTKV